MCSSDLTPQDIIMTVKKKAPPKKKAVKKKVAPKKKVSTKRKAPVKKKAAPKKPLKKYHLSQRDWDKKARTEERRVGKTRRARREQGSKKKKKQDRLRRQ